MFQCVVADDAHPECAGMTGYVVMRTPDGRVMGIDCVQMGVVGKAAAKVTPSLLRDLPLTRWDNACRARIAATVSPAPADQWSEGFEFLQLSADEQQEIIVRTLVSVRYPEAQGDESPGGRRRLAALVRSARTATEYGSFMKQGRSDPAVAIAEKHNVSHSTARTWIHRARGHGFLPPASAKGEEARVDRQLQTLADLKDLRAPVGPRASVDPAHNLDLVVDEATLEMMHVAETTPFPNLPGVMWRDHAGDFWARSFGTVWRRNGDEWLVAKAPSAEDQAKLKEYLEERRSSEGEPPREPRGDDLPGVRQRDVVHHDGQLR